MTAAEEALKYVRNINNNNWWYNEISNKYKLYCLDCWFYI